MHLQIPERGLEKQSLPGLKFRVQAPFCPLLKVLEAYNRQDNLRVVGIKCETKYEQNEVTETKVLDVAKKNEVTMASSDISKAH